MRSDQTPTENLFAYGTLQTPAVQLSTFGRILIGESDALVGYHLRMIRIDDREFVAASGTADHRNLEFTGNDSDVVEGTVFTITNIRAQTSRRIRTSGLSTHAGPIALRP